MSHDPRTYCNPLNIEYRFQVKGWAEECVREAADPSVAFYKDEYWLFPSKSGGYWRSSDLLEWRFVPTAALPAEDYAPDVRVMNDVLYFTASRSGEPASVYRTTDPASDSWEHVSDPLSYVDPNMFQDEDGRIYFYWGCSNEHPIQGVEMNPASMMPIGEPVDLLNSDATKHGWERCDDNNAGAASHYTEGAWMAKKDGKYYLQYAAPGTEWNIYADGVYVGDAPLGPFTYQRHNPFSHKPGGFINGAGHGSTFEDRHGNLWHIATMRISVRHMFERRLGLFPAGFDSDGVLFCNTQWGDYPTRVPEGAWNPWTDSFPGWMLLSHEKSAASSSLLDGHAVENAFDEDVRTYWSAATGDAGEWLSVDLAAACTINAVQINFAEHACDQYEREGEQLKHQYLLEASNDGETWRTIHDKRENERDVPHDYVELAEPVKARHLRLTNHHMPAKGTLAVSGLRVFGRGEGEAPAATSRVVALRAESDAMTAHVSWGAVEGATGYNVRWGIAPDKLYNCWMVYGADSLELRALNGDTDYWLAVDAFNENGVARGDAVAVE